MIARHTGHGHDFLARPSHNVVQLAYHSLGPLVVVLLAGKPANFMDHSGGPQQLARILSGFLQEAKVSQAVMNLNGESGNAATMLQVSIKESGPGLQLLKRCFTCSLSLGQGGPPNAPEGALA